MSKIQFKTCSWTAPLDAFQETSKKEVKTIEVRIYVPDYKIYVAVNVVVNSFEFNLVIGSKTKNYLLEGTLARVNNVPTITNIRKVVTQEDFLKLYGL